MWRYTRALDTGDGTAYASTYTVDGRFVPRSERDQRTRGVEEDGRWPQGDEGQQRKQRASRRGLRCITWKPTPGSSSSTRTTPATTPTT